jgi:surface protein
MPAMCRNINMFYNAKAFDQDISNWDVSNVTDISYMFHDAESFDQDISKWDVSKVTDMSYMFSFSSESLKCCDTWQAWVPVSHLPLTLFDL